MPTPRRGFVLVNRLRHGHEASLAIRLGVLLVRQGLRIAGGPERGWRDTLDAELRRDEPEMLSLIRASLVASSTAMARLRLELLASLRKGRMDDRLVAFARARAAEQVRGINRVTRDRVNRAVTHSTEERADLATTVRRVEAVMVNAAPFRARGIARTEIGTATSFGDDEAARESGLPLRRAWLTAADGGLRHPSAPGLEGQTRDMGEPFDVRGYKLEYPLDPNGPASEIVNCRCALEYIVL